MEISKRYNSDPLNDSSSLFTPIPLFSGTYPPIFGPGPEFWDKNDYNSVPVNDLCALFTPTPPPIFRPELSDAVT